MKKTLVLCVLLGALVVAVCLQARRISQLTARVAELEQREPVSTSAGVRSNDPRIDQLQERLGVVEDILEKKITRQGLDSKLKDIRDMPNEPPRRL